MELKKLHMGTVVFGWDSMDEVANLLRQSLGEAESIPSTPLTGKRKPSLSQGIPRGRRDMTSRVHDAVLALATCHNVSPACSGRHW